MPRVGFEPTIPVFYRDKACLKPVVLNFRYTYPSGYENTSKGYELKTKLRGVSPQANHTDRATYVKLKNTFRDKYLY
jgi:hypothetical protein